MPWATAGLLAALAAVLTFDPKIYINGDNVDYMLLARSILGGDLWPEGRFPPLFPALLAATQSILGQGGAGQEPVTQILIPQKILVLIFYLASIWMLGRLIARRVPLILGPWLLLAAMTLIPVVEYAHYVMSEIPYLFLLLGALDAADRLPRGALDRRAGGAGGEAGGPEAPGVASAGRLRPASAHRDRPFARREILRIAELSLWIAAAFYVRSAGVTLGLGILACLLAGRRWRQAAGLAVGVGLLLIPWIVRSATHAGGNPYVQQILMVNPLYPEFGTLTPAFLWNRIRDNSVFYLVQQIPCLVLPALYRSTYSRPEVRDAVYPVWLALPLLAPLVLGLLRGLRRLDPAAWAAAAGLGLTLLWPWIWRGSRFLVPILPLLFLFWWSGWGPRLDLGRRSSWRWIRIGILVLVLGLGARNLILYARETRTHPPEWAHYFRALEWIRTNTPDDSMVIDRKPGFVELVARRRASNFPREEDPDRMIGFLREAGADYVVLPSLPIDDIARYMLPAVEKSRPYFEVAHSEPSPETYVLRFYPEGGRGEASPQGAEGDRGDGDRPAPPDGPHSPAGPGEGETSLDRPAPTEGPGAQGNSGGERP